MGVQNPNSTSYQHPDEPNLLNLHKALEYNGQGQPTIRVRAQFGGTSGAYNDNTGIDAFGKLRTSSPYTLFDNSFRYGDNAQKWNSGTSGTATVSHLDNESSMSLAIGTASGDSIIRETKHVFKYQPGKSLQVINSFVMATPKANLRQRVGYFGVNDGVYFMTLNTEKYFVIRKSTSGSVDDTTERVAQSAWNLDTLDGSGDQNNPSGIELDVTKTQIFWMDIEWLGVGSVRCGFVINGVFVICHVFHHANSLTAVYMKTADLPVRLEITNTGETGSSSTLKQICSTVISEGGYQNRSISRSVATALIGKNISETVLTPLVAIRLKSTRLDAVVIPKLFDVYGIQQAAFRWALILNPTLNAGTTTFTDAGADSSVEYNVVATGMTGGTVIAEGIFVGQNRGGSVSIRDTDIDGSLQLGRFLNGTADILCLAATATTNNDDAVGSITWQEHT
jgi:hypothetical protein